MMKKKWQWVMDASSKTSGNLLDVGAGTGHFAKFMQDHGWTITALEPDSTARQVALQKLNLQIDPLESLLTMTGEVFDVITLWHVLEHVHDVKGYLEKFRQILKPDGILLIAVPNHTSRDARQYGSKWAALDVPRHLWHFSPDSMKRLLQTQGFVLQKKITMPLDGFYVSMLSEKYKRNNWMGPVAAIVSGLKTINASKRNVDRASSLIYISRKKK
jgi:SAM-dependent methyltransferase